MLPLRHAAGYALMISATPPLRYSHVATIAAPHATDFSMLPLMLAARLRRYAACCRHMPCSAAATPAIRHAIMPLIDYAMLPFCRRYALRLAELLFAATTLPAPLRCRQRDAAPLLPLMLPPRD